MVFTLQFQQFSKARGQWLTDVLVVKDLKFWVLVSYIPRIIAWISPYNKGEVSHRIVLTQGVVYSGLEQHDPTTGLLPTTTQLIKDQLKDTKLRLVA